MTEPIKTVQLRFSNFFVPTLASLGLILCFWLLFYGLAYLGYSLPSLKISRFHELGFFAVSSFSFITFLTMIPFQRAEEKLSPGFYTRILRTPWAHFGLYVLFYSSIICFVAISIYQQLHYQKHLNLLFFALVASIVSATIFHRFWVLRCLHEPYLVYANIAQLTEEHSIQEVWLELLECTYKTLGDKRLSDGKDFILLLEQLYLKIKTQEKINSMNEDLESLYKLANHLRPFQRQMEKQWPFLFQKQTPFV